jgi:hypothetical protein
MAMGPLLLYFFITIFGTKTGPSLISSMSVDHLLHFCMVLLFLWLTLVMLFFIPQQFVIHFFKSSNALLP